MIRSLVDDCSEVTSDDNIDYKMEYCTETRCLDDDILEEKEAGNHHDNQSWLQENIQCHNI